MIEFYYKSIFYILFVIVIILSIVLISRNPFRIVNENFTDDAESKLIIVKNNKLEQDILELKKEIKKSETTLLIEINKGKNADNDEITKLKELIKKKQEQIKKKQIEIMKNEIKIEKIRLNNLIKEFNDLKTQISDKEKQIKAKKEEIDVINDGGVKDDQKEILKKYLSEKNQYENELKVFKKDKDLKETKIEEIIGNIKVKQLVLSRFVSDYEDDDYLKGFVESDPNVVRERNLNNMLDRKTIGELNKQVTKFDSINKTLDKKIDSLDSQLADADIEDKQRFYGESTDKEIYNKNFLYFKNIVLSKHYLDEYKDQQKDENLIQNAFLTLVKAKKNLESNKDSVFEFEDNLYYIKLDNGFLKYNGVNDYGICNLDIESILNKDEYGFCQSASEYGIEQIKKNELNNDSFFNKSYIDRFDGDNGKNIIISKNPVSTFYASNYNNKQILINETLNKITNSKKSTDGKNLIVLTIETSLTANIKDEPVYLVESKWPSYQKMVSDFSTPVPYTDNCIDDRPYLFNLIKIYTDSQFKHFTKVNNIPFTSKEIKKLEMSNMYKKSQPLFYLIAPFNYNLQFLTLDFDIKTKQKFISIDYAKDEKAKDDNSKMIFMLSDEYDFGDTEKDLDLISKIQSSIENCENKRCK